MTGPPLRTTWFDGHACAVCGHPTATDGQSVWCTNPAVIHLRQPGPVRLGGDATGDGPKGAA